MYITCNGVYLVDLSIQPLYFQDHDPILPKLRRISRPIAYECNVEPQIPLPSFELKYLEALHLAGPEDHLQQRLLGIHHWTLMTWSIKPEMQTRKKARVQQSFKPTVFNHWLGFNHMFLWDHENCCFFGREITSKFELKMLTTPLCCRLGATARSFGVQSGQPSNLHMTSFEVLEPTFDCAHLSSVDFKITERH